MAHYVIRLWLADRPGALGAVASRIGAVRADVVSIDIIERAEGRALDELTVDLADVSLLNLLVAEIEQVDGVQVAHIRPAFVENRDPALAALNLASKLAACHDEPAVFQTFVDGFREVFGADWVLIVPGAGGEILARSSSEDAPSEEWFNSFVAGIEADERPFAAVDEMERFPFVEAPLEVVLSRKGANIVSRELKMVESLISVAETRLATLAN